MVQTVKIHIPGEGQAYGIAIGAGSIKTCGEWAKKCLPGDTRQILIVSNKKVYGLYGEPVQKSLARSGYRVSVWLMADGEKHKNLKSLEKLLAFLGGQGFTRADAVVALGGGVVGDLAGFAAAVYLRGIPVLQIPTTLLSQIDSSVGGKTAINTGYGKNLVGAFYQPRGVLIDIETLKTLPQRELTAGFCEAIKQAALAGGPLFAQTAQLLETYGTGKFAGLFDGPGGGKFRDRLSGLIKGQVSFKAKIVAGDQKEGLKRQDPGSRKILNFGHTIGHALEKVVNYQRLRHGEAVGYGMLAAGEISKNLGFLDKNSLKSLVDVIGRAGPLPLLENIKPEDVIKAAAFDKKKAGTVTTWILLKEIGKPILIGDDKIPASMIKQSIKTILK
jgi:3-dehydroquinate synthase